jgi:endonuclease III
MTTKTNIKIYTDMQKAYENIQRAILDAQKASFVLDTLLSKKEHDTGNGRVIPNIASYIKKIKNEANKAG